MVKRTTAKRLPAVMVAFGKFMEDEQNAEACHEDTSTSQKDFCRALDAYLDYLLHADGFGTEGQNDPRGDHRG